MQEITGAPSKSLKDFLTTFSQYSKQGTSNNLHKLFDEMNQLHTSIKFTMNHTSSPSEAEDDRCQCTKQSSIPFLDVLCSIQDGKIETDLYRKETDRIMYLLPSSCHPPSCTKNIVRICSKPEYREKQFLNLKAEGTLRVQ